MKRKLGVLMLTATVASAQLGGLAGILGGILGGGAGIPVFDSSNWAESILQKIELVKQVTEAVKQTEKLTEQYKHMRQQAEIVANLRRYQSPWMYWKGMAATNYSGRNKTWIDAVNHGLKEAEAYADSTTRVANPSVIITNLTGTGKENLLNDVATLELQDGANIATLGTIGRVRSVGPDLEAALHNIEEESLAQSLDSQTEAMQLNRIASTGVIQAKATNYQNQLLASLAEMELVKLREQAEAQKRALQNQVKFRLEGRRWMDETSGDFRSAQRNYLAYMRSH